ncbi:JAB domain-containing protein [Lutibacter sp. A64]
MQISGYESDCHITQKMKEVSKLMDITVIDHLIVSSSQSFYSFSDEGIL